MSGERRKFIARTMNPEHREAFLERAFDDFAATYAGLALQERQEREAREREFMAWLRGAVQLIPVHPDRRQWAVIVRKLGEI